MMGSELIPVVINGRIGITPFLGETSGCFSYIITKYLAVV